MSNTSVDHAIAISATQQAVWAQVSDLSKNPRWQTNCESVSYLTTMHSGRGTRWRMHTKRGVEYVLEITAWYDRLGYEYTIVDGSPYVSNRGRIRLQEAPEGTIVQWTFNYEMKGMLSGLRNSLSVRRSVDNEIVESLQNLYTYIKELAQEEAFNPESTKALVQDAPDVLERANYKPRHPSALDRMRAATIEVPAISEDEFEFESIAISTSENSSIFEPPIADDDTKPNPTVEAPQQAPLPEPDFLQNAVPIDMRTTEVDQQSLPLLSDTEFEESTEAAPSLPILEELVQTPRVDQSKTLTTPLPDDPRDTSLDTAEISVFEVFGLQRPSETSRMRAIQESDIEASLKASGATRIVPDVAPRETRRQGLRASLRSQIIKLRTPSA